MTRLLLKQLILRTPGITLLDDMRKPSDMICFNNCITVGVARRLSFRTDTLEADFLAYVAEHHITRIAVYLVHERSLVKNTTIVRAFMA